MMSFVVAQSNQVINSDHATLTAVPLGIMSNPVSNHCFNVLTLLSVNIGTANFQISFAVDIVA